MTLVLGFIYGSLLGLCLSGLSKRYHWSIGLSVWVLGIALWMIFVVLFNRS